MGEQASPIPWLDENATVATIDRAVTAGSDPRWRLTGPGLDEGWIGEDLDELRRLAREEWGLPIKWDYTRRAADFLREQAEADLRAHRRETTPGQTATSGITREEANRLMDPPPFTADELADQIAAAGNTINQNVLYDTGRDFTDAFNELRKRGRARERGGEYIELLPDLFTPRGYLLAPGETMGDVLARDEELHAVEGLGRRQINRRLGNIDFLVRARLAREIGCESIDAEADGDDVVLVTARGYPGLADPITARIDREAVVDLVPGEIVRSIAIALRSIASGLHGLHVAARWERSGALEGEIREAAARKLQGALARAVAARERLLERGDEIEARHYLQAEHDLTVASDAAGKALDHPPP